MNISAPLTFAAMRRNAVAILLYPAQPAALTTLVALSLALLLTIAPFVGIVVLLIVWAAACRYAVEVLDRSANGSLKAPEFAAEPDNTGWMLLILQVLFLVSKLWLDHGVETPGLRWSGYAALACLQPAMTLTAAMNRNLAAALNPSLLLRVVRQLGMAYALLVLATIVLGGVQQTLTSMIYNWVPVAVGQVFAGFVWFYLMVMYFHLLGRLVYVYRKEFDFTPIPESRLLPEDRHAPLLDRVNRLMEASDIEGAAQLLHLSLTSEPHTTPAMHARYRELLMQLGDHAGLNAHAQARLGALLVAGAEREALILLRESLVRDPQFRPQSAGQAVQLAHAAERLGQFDLVLALLQDFVVQYPRDPDGPASALTASRLLIERHADVAGARAVLQSAIEHYASHPDYDALLQQLAALDQLSSQIPGVPSATALKKP
jgi:tetratricopeptide (TPR) repeat protein